MYLNFLFVLCVRFQDVPPVLDAGSPSYFFDQITLLDKNQDESVLMNKTMKDRKNDVEEMKIG